MTCENCKNELKSTFVYRYIDSGLEMQLGYECLHCGAIYNIEGVQLELPYSERQDDEDETDG